jgi:hypothetical protein
MHSQRSWWRLALAVEASAEWFTPYAKVHASLPRSRFVKYRQGWLREPE